MRKVNVWKDVQAPLEVHSDDRGTIADMFYNESINHVAIIKSKKGVIRGNHYHKKTTQHVLVTKGSFEYWTKKVDSNEPASHVIAHEGDMVTSGPFEIHAFRFLSDNEFIVFSQGLRGGKDYEADTFRVPSIIPEN